MRSPRSAADRKDGRMKRRMKLTLWKYIHHSCIKSPVNVNHVLSQ